MQYDLFYFLKKCCYFPFISGAILNNNTISFFRKNFEVEKIINHESFDPNLKPYDIALLKLKTEVCEKKRERVREREKTKKRERKKNRERKNSKKEKVR